MTKDLTWLTIWTRPLKSRWIIRPPTTHHHILRIGELWTNLRVWRRKVSPSILSCMKIVVLNGMWQNSTWGNVNWCCSSCTITASSSTSRRWLVMVGWYWSIYTCSSGHIGRVWCGGGGMKHDQFCLKLRRNRKEINERSIKRNWHVYDMLQR